MPAGSRHPARPFYEPAVLVVICGFFMIYGIVHVTAEGDEGFFAGLKALGMTPRQIRSLLSWPLYARWRRYF